MKNRLPNSHAALMQAFRICAGAVVLLLLASIAPPIALFGNGPGDYASVHLLQELFSILVSAMVASMAWYALGRSRSPDISINLLAGFSIVAGLDVFHALSYDGMPKLFTEASTAKAIFFWMGGRTAELITVLLFGAGLKLPGSRSQALGAALAFLALNFYIGSFHLDWFPTLFVPGVGVTPIKAGLEYALSFGNLFAAALVYRNFLRTGDVRMLWIGVASLITGLGELAFTTYVAPSDFLNVIGHLFKIASYALIYRAVFLTSVQAPYDKLEHSSHLIFRQQVELNSLLRNVPVEIARLDSGLRYRYVNPAFAQRVKKQEKDLIDKHWAQSLPADWPLGIERELSEALTGKKVEFEFTVNTAEGAVWTASAVVVPERDYTGNIEGVLAIFTDTTERKKAEQEAQHMAFYDPLTGLPNRRLMIDRLHLAMASANRSSQYGALILLDLDNFKEINDTLGHLQGDEFLRQVGDRLSSCVREVDTVARMGGDEFVLILSDLSDDLAQATVQAHAVAEKVRSALGLSYHLNGFRVDSSASLGLVLFRDSSEREEELLKRADMALYRAKAQGRNQVCLFDPSLQDGVLARARLLSNLKQALPQGQFRLVYQPIVDTSTAIVGYEALLRWNHPERGVVSPADFIPLAEQTGLILPIGQWVLEQACRQLKAWSQLPDYAGKTLAVNVSARQFREPNFVAQVETALALSGADAHLLRIELTESMFHTDLDETMRKMKTLQALGVRFSLDDFGTGYSSLSYLKRLPLAQLKIDRAFVRDILQNPHDAAIASTILTLAKALALKVVAEGIETREQFDFLRQQGCDKFQGYYFGIPQPLGSQADPAEADLAGVQGAM